MVRVAWNKGLTSKFKGKAVGKKKAFSPEEIADIGKMLKRDPAPIAVRNWALFRFGIDTMLRSCDVVRATVGMVYRDGVIVNDFDIMQKKTGHAQNCDLLEETQDALMKWIKVGWDFEPDEDDILFAITERRHRQVIKGLAKLIRLDSTRYSTHSVRRTKAKEVYKRTKNLGVVRELLGHKSLASTSAYLGIDREDARTISREVKI